MNGEFKLLIVDSGLWMKSRMIIVLIKEKVKQVKIILSMKTGLMQVFVNLEEMLGGIISV